jgi:hypothetical protein
LPFYREKTFAADLAAVQFFSFPPLAHLHLRDVRSLP